MKRLIAALSLCLPLAACHPGDGGAPAPSDGPVTFELEIPADPFLDGGQVTITILDATQLDNAAQSEGCVTSWDGKTETTSCPDGRTPPEVKPETHTIAVADLGSTIKITSTTVSPGERFSLSVHGTAADNCNSSSGGFEGTADRSGVVTRTIDGIGTTEMACLDEPGEGDVEPTVGDDTIEPAESGEAGND